MAGNSASKYLYCSNSSQPYTLSVSWSESSPNITSNTSVISANGSIGAANVAWASNYTSYLKLYWHDNRTNSDTHFATSSGFSNCGRNYGSRGVSGSITVTHKDDGSLAGYVRIEFVAGSSSGGWAPGSTSLSTGNTGLTTIARASSFTINTGEGLLGSKVSISIDRKSSSFTHKVSYQFSGSSSVIVSDNASTSASFTPSIDLASQIPDSTIGVLTVSVSTWNGGTQIGSTVNKTANLGVPESIIPTIGSITTTIVNNGVPPSWGIYVQSFSKCTVKIETPKGIYGSTIKSYSITGGGLNATTQSATTEILNNIGNLTFICKITDSRGRIAEKRETINVVAYSRPSLSLRADRCNDEGNIVGDGTSLLVNINYSFSNVSGKNSIISKSVNCNNTSNTNFEDNVPFILEANCSIGATYILTATITDALGNSFSASINIPTASRILNIRKNKDGLAIGKFAEKPGFEVAWDTVFDGKVEVNELKASTFSVEEQNAFNIQAAYLYAEEVEGVKYNNVFPIGAVYISVTDENPSKYFGGTWVQFGQGRTLVGVNTSDSSFNTVEKTGGEKTHTLTINEMPSHNHYNDTWAGSSSGTQLLYFYGQQGTPGARYTGNTGGGAAHNNLQPYITVYFWKRTA